MTTWNFMLRSQKKLLLVRSVPRDACEHSSLEMARNPPVEIPSSQQIPDVLQICSSSANIIIVASFGVVHSNPSRALFGEDDRHLRGSANSPGPWRVWLQ
jgi:hypothetical protein